MKTKFIQIGAIVLACFWASCNSRELSEESKISQKTTPIFLISSQELDLTEDYVADINAMQNVEIRSRVKGFLNQIHVDEGKLVKKGQVLFSISDDIYQSELKKSKANTQIAIADAKAAELTMQNAKVLVDKGVVNKTEYELAKAKYESLLAKVEEAKANQQMAEINLSYAIIRAPFDGIIDRIPFKVGSVIDEGALLTSLSDVTSMHVYFKISEIEYLNFMKKKSFLDSFKAQLVLADGSVHEDIGRIETIEGDFETGTGTIAIRAKFPNTKKILKHGSSGRIRLTNQKDKAILIPQKSTFEIQDRIFVYIVGNNNVLEIKSLKSIQRHNEYYLISDTTFIGKTIVYEGIQGLKEGDIIKPQIISSADISNGLSK